MYLVASDEGLIGPAALVVVCPFKNEVNKKLAVQFHRINECTGDAVVVDAAVVVGAFVVVGAAGLAEREYEHFKMT